MKSPLAVLVLLPACLPHPSFANGPAPGQAAASESVPQSFFGIDLGRVVVYDSKKKAPDLPLKLIRTDVGSAGLTSYFRPTVDNPIFPFKLGKQISDRNSLAASHDVLLTPIPPNFRVKPEQLRQVDLFTYEVTEINWTESVGRSLLSTADDYQWAKQLCDAIETKMTVKPNKGGNKELHLYSCEFEQFGRLFTIHSFHGKSMRLSYSKDIMDKKYADLKRYAQEVLSAAALSR